MCSKTWDRNGWLVLLPSVATVASRPAYRFLFAPPSCTDRSNESRFRSNLFVLFILLSPLRTLPRDHLLEEGSDIGARNREIRGNRLNVGRGTQWKGVEWRGIRRMRGIVARCYVQPYRREPVYIVETVGIVSIDFLYSSARFLLFLSQVF